LSVAESVRPHADSYIIPDGRAIVVLSGDLDIAAASLISDAFADAAGRTRTGVIGDLSRVSFIDTSGLAALLGASESARHLPGGLSFSGIPGHINRLLGIAGLSDRFPVALPPVTLASPVRYADPGWHNFGRANPGRTNPGRTNPGRARWPASTGVSLAAAAAVHPAPPSVPSQPAPPSTS
jgi:anti-sigma B factor antagonist